MRRDTCCQGIDVATAFERSHQATSAQLVGNFAKPLGIPRADIHEEAERPQGIALTSVDAGRYQNQIGSQRAEGSEFGSLHPRTNFGRTRSRPERTIRMVRLGLQRSKPEARMKERSELLARITARPDVFDGKPIVRDIRIPVGLILDLLAQGVSQEATLGDCPDPEPDDFRACTAYAHAVVAQDTL